MTSEPASESTASKRPLLSPPDGISFGGRKSIALERTRIARAGWRLLIYIVFFLQFAAGQSVTRYSTQPAPDHALEYQRIRIFLVQEVIGLIAALVAAKIMGILEGRPFSGSTGCPARRLSERIFGRGSAGAWRVITAVILLIPRSRRIFFLARWRFTGARFGVAPLSVGHGVFLAVRVFEGILVPRLHAIHSGRGNSGFWPAATVISAAFAFTFHLVQRGEDVAGSLKAFLSLPCSSA